MLVRGKAMAEQKIIIGNSLEVLKTMPSESVDVCITSPPYWGLRDYGQKTYTLWENDSQCEHSFKEEVVPIRTVFRDTKNTKMGVLSEQTEWHCSKCGSMKCQLGMESDFKDYIKHLCMIFDEVKRVLKPTGACWVNIADTYNGNKKGNTETVKNNKVSTDSFFEKAQDTVGIKSLCNIPSRFAIAMTDRGWILRNSIIWHKPNAMPESVKDRFTDDYEMFYFFVKSPRYYFNQIKEHAKTEQTKHIRSVWSINTKPSEYSHIAMFPESLVSRPIQCCCPNGGTVLDIFCGSGTTLAYCRRNDINAIGIDINENNKAIIEDRLNKVKDSSIRDLRWFD